MSNERSLPFDQRHVFDRLPLSEDQKLALLKRMVTEKTETADQSNTEPPDSDQIDDACAVVDLHHPDHRETVADSHHQMDLGVD